MEEDFYTQGNDSNDTLIKYLDTLDLPSSFDNRSIDSSIPCFSLPDDPSNPSPDFTSTQRIFTSPPDQQQFQQSMKKKRGRKPLRPNDPVKLTTEVKDKYWLRAFRAYMKNNYDRLKEDINPDDQLFWKEYLGFSHQPEAGIVYASYGRKYKNYLVSHPTFSELFTKWFRLYGEAEVTKKHPRDSDLWFVLYDYALHEMLNYFNVTDHSQEVERKSEGKS